MPRPWYPVTVIRPWTALLVALSIGLSSPALAQSPPADPTNESVAAENAGYAAYEAGRDLEAAQKLAEALRLAPREEGARIRRSSLASSAAAAYKLAFEADHSQCAALTAGLAVVQNHLDELRSVYGDTALAADDYIGLMKSREELEQAKAGSECDKPKPDDAGPVGGEVEPPQPPPVEPDRPKPPKSHAKAFAAGIGVSAAVAIGMAVGTGVFFTRLDKPDGKLYRPIYEAAKANRVSTAEGSDMCLEGMGIAALESACANWNRGKQTMVAFAVVAGVAAVSAVVFTGLLIRDRNRQRGAQAWQRHGVQFGAGPQPGGFSLAAGFRF